jgi:anti-sigma regulatory factor (Ser/Thr protein kinase)
MSVAINVTMELEPEATAGAKARQILQSRVSELVPAMVLWDLLTVVTELVNNSVRHGPGDPIQVRITVNDDGSVRGEVEDQGDGEVALREMIEDGPGGGMGLHVVEALADRWAVYEGSTHVWFEMSPPSRG